MTDLSDIQSSILELENLDDFDFVQQLPYVYHQMRKYNDEFSDKLGQFIYRTDPFTCTDYTYTALYIPAGPTSDRYMYDLLISKARNKKRQSDFNSLRASLTEVFRPTLKHIASLLQILADPVRIRAFLRVPFDAIEFQDSDTVYFYVPFGEGYFYRSYHLIYTIGERHAISSGVLTPATRNCPTALYNHLYPEHAL